MGDMELVVVCYVLQWVIGIGCSVLCITMGDMELVVVCYVLQWVTWHWL